MQENYYNLYLDECMINTTDKKVYGIIGVIIKESELDDVQNELDALKNRIWCDMEANQAKEIVLHAVEVRGANKNFRGNRSRVEYEVFRANSKKNDVFVGIKDIIMEKELGIIGSVVDLNSLSNRYKIPMDNYLGDSVCLRSIINNFTCFLKSHEGTGKIIFESRATHDSNTSDAKIKKQFYKIMTHGTNIYKPLVLQSVIEGISFSSKQKNLSGIQIADFIAQPFILHHSGEKQKQPNIYKDIRKRRYSGECSFGGPESSVFGVTYIK